VTGDVPNPQRFFDAFPRFAETSETGPWLDRLNARYMALIHPNRDILHGARVLDLGSHDGRFSFAALKSGAERVIGIELDHRLVKAANANMEAHGVPRESYGFVLGDIVERIDEVEPFDVVLCFGLLYHLTDHMLLLSKIAAREPRYVLIDTHVSERKGAVIELQNAFGQSPPPPGSYIEGRPTKAALEAMLSYFGWTFEYFDWAGSGLADAEHAGDYRSGRRVSMRVACNEKIVPAEERERAVQLVFEADEDRRSQWIAITQIAPRFGMTPEALRFWVRRAERERLYADE
jgi:Methyltransferase domain